MLVPDLRVYTVSDSTPWLIYLDLGQLLVFLCNTLNSTALRIICVCMVYDINTIYSAIV